MAPRQSLNRLHTTIGPKESGVHIFFASDSRACLEIRTGGLKNIISSEKKYPIKKDSIYYFIKSFPTSKEIKKLKELNNFIVYEPCDAFWREKEKAYKKLLNERVNEADMVVHGSYHALERYPCKTPSRVIYWQNNPRFPVPEKPVNKLIYMGAGGKLSIPNKYVNKYNIQHISFDSRPFNYDSILNGVFEYRAIHLDFILNDNINFHRKVSSKLATALHSRSIFICNRTPLYGEILGEDYHFYINDDLSNFDQIIEKAKHTLKNKKLYKEHLKSMESHRIKLSPETAAEEYYKVIEFGKKIIKQRKEIKKC